MAGTFFKRQKELFRNGSLLLKLIYINVGIFLVLRLTDVVLMLFNSSIFPVLTYIEIPSNISYFLIRPWTLFTYMVVHYDLFHILFNMLWLYWFGQIFLLHFGEKQLGGLYLLGGLAGGLFYLLAYNTFPYFDDKQGLMCGASASILAIVIATAMRAPDFKVNLFLFGAVSLKYIAAVTVVIDLLSVTSANGGGHIAHLGGALVGLWFILRWNRGKDITRPINRMIDAVTVFFKPRPKKIRFVKTKRQNVKRTESDMEYNAHKKRESEELDAILDKIKKSGYSALTEEEKKRLFEVGNRS